MTVPVSPPTRCFLTVETENDPTIAARVLGLLTVRGEIPEWFSVRKHGAAGLRIAIELAGLDPQAAHFVAQRIGRLPTVTGVTRSWLRQKDPLPA